MKPILAIKYLLVFIVLAAMGCEDTIVERGWDVSCRMNQLYNSDDGQYTVKITEVGDSRCAEGVVCIWQGEVTVKGEFTNNGTKSLFEVHSVVSAQNTQPAGYTIKIIDAQPYPKSGTETKPEDLVITLLIQKQ